MSRIARILPAMAAVAVLAAPAHAQLVGEFAPQRPAGCCLLGNAQRLTEQLADWNQLGRYAQANRELMQQPVPRGRVVFMGDSITDGWDLAAGFPGKPYVNRGIGGQTTAQMLVRFYPDVIALRPAAVAIFAGTNDIAGNNGPQTLAMVQQNIMAMVELAKVHGIRVVLCALTPVTDAKTAPPERGGGPVNQTRQRPPADILLLNAWLKSYAREAGAGFADYHAATVGADGLLRPELTGDGLHPNAAGYKLMQPVIEAALEAALR
ncbi:MAG TPA: SGNH/GDSL hydrolase family protein [Steroidobacteraceae bacterium]|nr:SGNH/GDSL hydrolase family protein [Steroidobacteraceae bacterium]